MDRRIKKTKTAVMNAVFDLLMEKDSEKVTVLEICQKADINKSTFYLHYKNAQDCFQQCIGALMDQLLSYCSDLNYDQIRNDPTIYIQKLLNEVELSKPVLEKFKASKFSGSMLKWVKNELVKNIAANNGFTLQENYREYLTITFFVGGFVDTILEALADYDRDTLETVLFRSIKR